MAGPAGASPLAPAPEPAPAPDAGLVTIPNVITFARLCAVPAAIWLIIQHRLDLAFYVFVAAGLSDGVDGWIARRWHLRSRLGAVLDPIADKALLVSVYVTLAAIGVLPDWLAILVVFRDLVIVGGYVALYLAGAPQPIHPILLSKVNTALQIGLAALALLLAGFALEAPGLLDLGIWAVAASTLGSGVAYVAGALRRGPAP
jgi:cardiolipin synthase (CMP-forming)